MRDWWTNRTKRPILLAAVSLLVILVYLWASAIKSDVPVFDVPRLFGDSLMLRYESEDGGDLLITRTRLHYQRKGGVHPNPVYRYDSADGTLEEGGGRDWDMAAGEIIKTFSTGSATDARLIVKDGRLRHWGKAIKSRTILTKGETALGVCVDSPGRLTAVFSADGRKRPVLRGWFVSAGGGYRGQHYVEFFELPSAERIGDAVRIPFTTAEGMESGCWSEDEKYFVLASHRQMRLCVIHVGHNGE